jgi:olfactory receptor
MLVNMKRQNKTISYTGCLIQVCFVLIFAGLENFLLVAMAYDHYVMSISYLNVGFYMTMDNDSVDGIIIIL